MVGDLQGRRMRTGSKIENLSTVVDGESRRPTIFTIQLFVYNVNRAAYKWFTEILPTTIGVWAGPVRGLRYVRLMTIDTRGGARESESAETR